MSKNAKILYLSVGEDATWGAIQKARKNYLFGTEDPKAGQKVKDVFHRNACSETIERCEKFINGPHADPVVIDLAIRTNHLRKSETSGHLFIQLQ